MGFDFDILLLWSFILNIIMKGSKAVAEKSARLTLKELPFFSYTGNIIQIHGQFNNSLSTFCKTKRDLDKLTCLYDLDLFTLNTVLDCNLNPDNQSFVRIPSWYYSPHSFRQIKTKVETDTSFSVFHNNVVSLNRNLENLQTHILHELNFHFNIIGVSETKITNANSEMCMAKIPGYSFEYIPTPLSSGGVGLFIDELLNCRILEKISNEAFQALWAEITFENKKNVICRILYRQHNSPERFQLYFDECIEKFTPSGKDIVIMGDFNIDLLKCELSNHSHDFLCPSKLLSHSCN